MIEELYEPFRDEEKQNSYNQRIQEVEEEKEILALIAKLKYLGITPDHYKNLYDQAPVWQQPTYSEYDDAPF